VLIQPEQDNLFLLSTAHNEADLQKTLQAAADTFKTMRS
jgi:glutamate-1-semialdehyde aminotransferase